MTEPWPGKHDDRSPEHFLEDGIAPSVIGGGPPESPFDVEPEPEPPGRHAQPRQQQPPQQYRQPDYQAEPPTSPIPVVRQLPREEEEQKRKSWVSRMLRLPDK
jgi:hypothetical protein